MTVWFANQSATFLVRYRGLGIWEYEVTWCQHGKQWERHGYAFSQERVITKAENRCKKINDSKRWWHD